MRGISRNHSKQWHTEAADFYFYFYFLLHQVALIAYTTKKKSRDEQANARCHQQPAGWIEILERTIIRWRAQHLASGGSHKQLEFVSALSSGVSAEAASFAFSSGEGHPRRRQARTM